MILPRGNKVLLVGAWCNGLFKPICHLELRVIVPGQQWMRNVIGLQITAQTYIWHKRFLFDSVQWHHKCEPAGCCLLHLVWAYCPRAMKEACASTHHGLCRYFLVAENAKSCWTNCPLSSLVLECPRSALLDNHLLFFQVTLGKQSSFIYPHPSFPKCSVRTRQDFVTGQHCPVGS